MRETATTQIRRWRKALQSSLWLALLSFVVTTSVLPSLAQQPPETAIVQSRSEAQTALDRARVLYEGGRFAQAAQLWQQAREAYQRQGDRLQEAASLNYLSLAYQDLGEWERATRAIAESFALLGAQSDPGNAESALILAQALNARGTLELARGQIEAAANTWKEAQDAYAIAKDDAGKLGSQINHAIALQKLGLYRRSRHLLEAANQQLRSQPDSEIKVSGLQNLAIALQVVGDLEQSHEILTQSLAIARGLEVRERISPRQTAAILFNLGNISRSLQQPQAAFEYYQQAAEKAKDPLLGVEIQLNQLNLAIQTEDWPLARTLFPSLPGQLAELPASRASVYAKVNFAESAINYQQKTNESPWSVETAHLLASAVQQARSLQDARAESYALGQLGHLYESANQGEEAQKLTQQALAIAEGINSTDLVAPWQWQLGRVLNQQGDTEGAIAALSEAVNSLEALRSDLVAINPDVQFSFTESVEPVYRQLVSLLLKSNNPSQKNLKQARQTIEALQLAELDNFFREACLDAQPVLLDEVDATAAVIYPIILPDRLEVILSVPGQPLRHYSTPQPQEVVEGILQNFLESLNPFFADETRLELSQRVYDWLIRPAQADFAANNIETLVFVLDGVLRNLPMAALHDGEQYLVEKYNLALTPGLQLLAPRAIAREGLQAFTGGLTEARQGFSALPAVKSEMERIAAKLPTEVFLNEQFTTQTLKEHIETAPFPLIHLATHGQFSSNPEETFVLTWDDKIQVREFQTILRSREDSKPRPIELLVLSACQTAAGDKRAALGLAGVAVRSGARSTLATLWSVNDRSTAELMAEFYRQFTETRVSKAQALREAQQFLLKNPEYAHPYYWAPFILVGNWL
jgi:CHAT domain-containing protein